MAVAVARKKGARPGIIVIYRRQINDVGLCCVGAAVIEAATPIAI